MKKERISLILNSIIVLLTVFATIVMFCGIEFMDANEIVLENSKLGMFKFFTVDSNILMGFAALLFTIYELKYIKGKIKEIPKWLYSLKMMATGAVVLTFLVVFLYLGPIAHGSIYSMLTNANLFYHLFIPVLSFITFIFFEKTNKLNVKDCFYGLAPTFIYSIFYVLNLIMHIENGMVSTEYDWYSFVQKGMVQAIIICPLMYIITFVICYGLYKMNKKVV